MVSQEAKHYMKSKEPKNPIVLLAKSAQGKPRRIYSPNVSIKVGASSEEGTTTNQIDINDFPGSQTLKEEVKRTKESESLAC